MPPQHKLDYAQHSVDPASVGLRLDVFLARRFRCSRTSIKERMAGPVLNQAGGSLKWSRKLRAGEIVMVPRIHRPEPKVEVKYKVLHQDQWLVVVDKGPGAPVHPVRSFRTRTVLTHLRRDLNSETLSPAHRLDRETSGVLLFGQNSNSTSRLMAQFAQGRVEKEYLALVSGRPDFDQLVLDAPLGPDPSFPIRCKMKVDREGGQRASTEFRVLRREGELTLISARPRTGRTHQIRVHLASLGLPLVGDKLYRFDGEPYLAMIGDNLSQEWLERLGHHRHALHAARLSIEHPQSGVRTTFEAPLADDLSALLDQAASD